LTKVYWISRWTLLIGRRGVSVVRIELIQMKGTNEPTPLNVTFTKWSIFVGATVIQRPKTAFVQNEHNDVTTSKNSLDIPLFQLIEVSHPIPFNLRHSRMIARVSFSQNLNFPLTPLLYP
tara:strand:- start:538 stop:897 length:360 start_codon:yes stop_codon:yes gene_type:complete